jgi:S1-C subfamily serine protease
MVTLAACPGIGGPPFPRNEKTAERGKIANSYTLKEDESQKPCTSKRDPAEVDWLGARIKNVVGMGEMSALGLPSEAGVVIVTAPPGSVAAKAGFRARDVIVKLGGKEVSERGEFLRRYEAAAAGSTLSLVIVRDQNEQTLSIQRGAEKKN